MLSDEEKKVIEYTKEEYKRGKEQNNVLFPIYLYQAEILLNLIEKQQKEIEELKNADLTTVYLNGLYDGEKKVEDKIKAKIKESELLIDNSQGCMSDEDLYKEYGKIEFGKSLLEKE